MFSVRSSTTLYVSEHELVGFAMYSHNILAIEYNNIVCSSSHIHVHCYSYYHIAVGGKYIGTCSMLTSVSAEEQR